MRESEMVLDCYNKLISKNLYKEIVMEVPYLSRCIDMIMVENNDDIISVEFKIKNWRQALRQANDHKLGVNRAYICIAPPKNGISSDLKKELEVDGIGLLVYKENGDFPFEEVVSAKKNNDNWKPYVSSLQDLINRIAERDVFKLKE